MNNNIIPTICIPTLYRYDLLERLFNSIDNCIGIDIKNIILIDNSMYNYKMKNIIDKLKNKYENLKVIKNDNNIGVAASWNRCINEINSEYYIFLNDDVQLNSNCLYKVNFLIKRSLNRNIIIASNKGTGFHFFSINKKTIEETGLFDDLIYPAYFEDFDYIKRVEKNNGIYVRFYDTSIHGDDKFNSSSSLFSNFILNSKRDYYFNGSNNYWSYKCNSLYNKKINLNREEHELWMNDNKKHIDENFYNNYFNRFNDRNILNIYYISENVINKDEVLNFYNKFKDNNIIINLFIFVSNNNYDKINFDLNNIFIINNDIYFNNDNIYNSIINDTFCGYLYFIDNLNIDDIKIVKIKENIELNGIEYIDMDDTMNRGDLFRYIINKDFIKYNRFDNNENIHYSEMIMKILS